MLAPVQQRACTLLRAVLVSFNKLFSGPGAGNSLGKAIMGCECGCVNESRILSCLYLL